MNKNNLVENLAIITPFKDKNNIKLEKTISCLYNQKISVSITHLILYDYSCNNISQIEKKFPTKKNYFLRFVSTNKKGIYKAINKGLDIIKKGSYYIVIGAGDLIFFNDIKKIEISKLLMCQYKLSNSSIYINSLRKTYEGMPYCHNAIIFKLNSLKYSNKYSICGDYDYFLKFLKHEQINLSRNKYFNKQISIIFESETGVSSKSIFKKHFENLLINYENLGLKYVLIYLFLKIKKIIIRIYD
tara:strand:- start:522 stop:1253 length:732 start_codon:yes stop_codon:yes gene_type:complete